MSSGNQPVKERLLLYLNDQLSVENALIDRLNERIGESQIQDAKRQLEHHLEETRGHQNRLRQLITEQGGSPTEIKANLSLPEPPKEMFDKTMRGMTPEEKELNATKQDLMFENAEIANYKTLIEVGRKMNVNVSPLEVNLGEEQEMARWINEHTPQMINQLWPKIEQSLGGGTAARPA